jgi:hypothetical protein
MRDPSPYAGTTVQLRTDALEIGGLPADVVDWYERTSGGVSWKLTIATDPRAQGYAIRRARAGLPDDDDVLFARVDGMGCLIHRTEIVGDAAQQSDSQFGPQPVKDSEIGQPCIACSGLLATGDMVAVRPLGPGASPEARTNARAGLPFEAVTIELHWACATGDESYQLPPAEAAPTAEES